MFVPDNQDQSFSRFLFVSVILHGILFITFPQWSAMLVNDLPGLERGGVIQVVAVDSSPNRQLSPITNRNSQTTVPKVAEPRPTAEPPKKDAVAIEAPVQLPEPAMPKPEPKPEPKLEEPKPVIPVPQSQPQPEVLPSTEPVPEPIKTESETPGQLLTSEGGQAMVIKEARAEVSPPPPAEIKPEVKPEQPGPTVNPDQQGELGGPSASGESKSAGDAEVASGIRESGQGTAETAPPAPPPPPSGRSLHGGGGNPVYPKNAEHDGAEGTVNLEVTVAATGRLMGVRVKQSSGDPRLDDQARRTIEQLWQFKSAAYDYVLELQVEFARMVENGLVNFHAEVSFGEVRWLNPQ